MHNKSIPIVISVIDKPFPSADITVPADIYLLLDNSLQIILKVSTLEMEINCTKNDTSSTFEVPAYLADALGLQDEITTNLRVHDNKLCMGPVIGVFTSVGQIRNANIQDPLFRLTELVKANEEANVILYHFTVRDVDFLKQRIYGTFYNHKTCFWAQKYFPYPDVLYDRGGGALKSQQARSDKIRQHVYTNEKVKCTNPVYYFDKWEVYQNLSSHQDKTYFLPHTVLYESPVELRTMLNSAGAIYIKECLANNGKGVFRVKKFPFSMFELSYFNGNLVTQVYNSFNALVHELDDLLCTTKVIIQAEIDVMKVDSCNVDLRALVQRNGKGEVEIGVCPVRVGKVGYPITNTSSGASVYRFDDFVYTKLKMQDEAIIETLRKRITAFLLQCFGHIEEAYGTCGEIGIDFALDKERNIWFIECNAKPGKDALYRVYDEETVKRAFLNPLEYGKFQSGY